MPITGKVVCAAAAPAKWAAMPAAQMSTPNPCSRAVEPKFLCLGRGPVCRIYVYLIGYAKIAQSVQRFANDGQIAVTAH